MRKFEVGSVYFVGFAGDHNLFVQFLVTKRTKKTITIEEVDGKTRPIWSATARTCRIIPELTARNDSETVFPLGRYSMAPVMRA